MKKVSLKEYAEKYNTKLTRRGKPMSESYLYRLIRRDLGRIKDTKPVDTRELWFRYELEGDKERIWVLI
jgi:hypothetical protein